MLSRLKTGGDHCARCWAGLGLGLAARPRPLQGVVLIASRCYSAPRSVHGTAPPAAAASELRSTLHDAVRMRSPAGRSATPSSFSSSSTPATLSIRSTSLLARRLYSSKTRPDAPRPVYAHEDLLLPSSTRSPTTSRRPKGSSSSSDPASNRSAAKQQSYFSPSYLLAEEPPLPPPSTSPLVPLSTPIPTPLPPTVLSDGLPNPTIRWRARPQTSIQDDVQLYKALGKFKLSSLVVLTTMAGYAMCPVDPGTTHAAMDAFAQSLTSSGVALSTDVTALAPGGGAGGAVGSSPANNLTLSVLLPTTVGTTLCAFSAASFNQLIEAPYDAQMARTRNRPLPKRTVTPLHAATYGALTGSVGLATLYAMNPLSAFLGLFTIVLYCPLYTISKRHSVYNTWLGSVVGAIPPLIGWAACTASVDPFSQPGAWALFALMFAWQFPHFMSLAHTLRSSYASSGYRMLAVLDPPKNALVSLRYSLALLPLCSIGFPYLGLTTTAFAYLSLIPNGILAVAAWRFWRRREDRRAKELFWASLVHLPVVLSLVLVTKKSLWTSDDDGDEDAQERGAVAVEQVEQPQQASAVAPLETGAIANSSSRIVYNPVPPLHRPQAVAKQVTM
ncbi:hypothetical protein JCM10908_006826 [Rhodotorula pacifica]|uniref:protoheme IX farnesyltransferase n=1 Tax=Rhodotorula pacifica TaxID=1495444 RepID=UPI00316AF48F